MIRNDEVLKVVREQLARAEGALESIRRDVLPKNPQMYALMSESYIDTILKLRGEIDNYLGIENISPNKDLEVSQEPSTDSHFIELSGNIRSVDLDAQTVVLRERPDNEPDLLCEYGPELEEAVKEYLDSRVLVTGTLETSHKTKRSIFSADSIEPLLREMESKASI